MLREVSIVASILFRVAYAPARVEHGETRTDQMVGNLLSPKVQLVSSPIRWFFYLDLLGEGKNLLQVGRQGRPVVAGKHTDE